MQDFLYQYLNWQMDNHNYVDTAETFSAIQGYQDTLTNDKFAGARLMAMGFVQWDKSEVDIWSGGSVLLLSLSFTDEQQLHFSVSGGTLSFYTFNMTNQVNKSDSWDFYFDGKTIYVATDVRGNALGNDGKPVNDMKNPGSIIAFIYDAKQ